LKIKKNSKSDVEGDGILEPVVVDVAEKEEMRGGNMEILPVGIPSRSSFAS
jgi:hypothetical protein